jgi:hypothetical protein
MTNMKKILLSTVLMLAFAVSSYAVPVRTAEEANLDRIYSPAQENICNIVYYNYCSGWVYYWTGWTAGATMGVCFDLGDCADCFGACDGLMDIWWGWKRITTYGHVDVEVFCADDNCCPTGNPLAGFYYVPVSESAWTHFTFDPPLDITGCAGMLIVQGRLLEPDMTVNYTDCNDCNINMSDPPCQTDPVWDCVAHSFIFADAVDYCGVYGTPAVFFITYPGTQCTWYGYSGFVADLLCDIYLMCEFPSATEDATWSEIKSLYK